MLSMWCVTLYKGTISAVLIENRRPCSGTFTLLLHEGCSLTHTCLLVSFTTQLSTGQ